MLPLIHTLYSGADIQGVKTLYMGTDTIHGGTHTIHGGTYTI